MTNPTIDTLRSITDHAIDPADEKLTITANGPIPEVGVNGITTDEALLAIVADRLRGFQGGPTACDENTYALLSVDDALYWLKRRTKDRMQRGIEGTHAV